MKKIAMGISDFKKFIDEDCYYVDKTQLISWIIDNPCEIHLITRPRRFGKTLNLSMIRYFMEAPHPNNQNTHIPPNKGGTGGELAIKGTDTPNPLTPANHPNHQFIDHHSPLTTHHLSLPHAYLFQNLKISTHTRCNEFMGRYPVIHLSFKNAKSEYGIDDCMRLLKKVLIAECERHSYILDYDFMTSGKKEYFQSILSGNASIDEYTSIIAELSAWLHQAYGKPAYILLDEYDTPLHSAYAEQYYDKLIPFIRSFMVQTFKDNPNLKQAVVIGILKIAQESIFSDFNNAAVSTILSTDMKDCFGFTEPEVETMASYFGMESEMEGIKEWYNGYNFGQDTIIYNPWSIINYIRAPENGLKPHWLDTSDNKLIREVINLVQQDIRETTEKLLRYDEVRKPLLSNVPYNRIKSDPEVVWSFLLHSGYLKATERQQVRKQITWRISIPNLEVEIAWETVVREWLKDDLSVNEHFSAFIQSIHEVNPKRMESELSNILYNMASYHDTAFRRASGEGRFLKGEGRGAKGELKGDGRRDGENFYHGLALGLLASLGPSWNVESNREYGEGRPDIVVVKKGNDPEMAEKAVILEFKQGNNGLTSLKKLAREAYKQVDSQYLNGVREKWHPVSLNVFGIGFKGKRLALYCQDKG